MQITTVKKKRYDLSSEERKALEVVSSLLDDFIEDEELTEVIDLETYADVRDARYTILTILELDKIEFNSY
jgi:uncharacterized protein YqeY